MDRLKDKVVARMTKLKDDIRDSISAKGLTATGRTERSLIVVDDGMTVTLYGRPFFPSLQYGSSRWTGRTGVRCSFEEFRGIIREWASAKGLNFGQNQQHERTISAITASIIRDGTRLWRTHGYIDVYDTLVAQCWQDLQSEAIGVASEAIDVVISKWQRM